MKATLRILTVASAIALGVQHFAQEAAAPAETKTASAGDSEKTLRLNFRGAPLDQVLNYMSDAAGFIVNIAPGTDVKGKVDVWSNQPLSKDDAVELLNTILNQNNLAAIRTGRTLTIVGRAEAKTRDLPVKVGADPKQIDKSDAMITQVIPVQYANASALVQNLQPLLPEYAQTALSANESGNALILTATQTDIRRMTEIVAALDTAIASVAEIKVYPLKYADAKSLVESVRELFTPPTSQSSQRGGGGRAEFLQNMFSGRGGGGPGGSGAGGGNTSRGNTSASAARLVAVADERSNSLIVAAPQDAIPEIDRLIKEIDVEVDDVTELRVFPLTNSDPQDLADIIAELFPDPTDSANQQQGGRFIGFGDRGPFGGGNRGRQQDNSSDRAKKQGRVVAVADARTSSLIVTAARDLMPQIEAMIKQLDSKTRGRQRVYVYNLENADVMQVEQVVRDMFDRSGNSRQNNNQNSALQNRSQQAAQNQGMNTTGIGQGGGGGGNNLGNQFGR